jgi:hypothetical protein
MSAAERREIQRLESERHDRINDTRGGYRIIDRKLYRFDADFVQRDYDFHNFRISLIGYTRAASFFGNENWKCYVTPDIKLYSEREWSSIAATGTRALVDFGSGSGFKDYIFGQKNCTVEPFRRNDGLSGGSRSRKYRLRKSRKRK